MHMCIFRTQNPIISTASLHRVHAGVLTRPLFGNGVGVVVRNKPILETILIVIVVVFPTAATDLFFPLYFHRCYPLSLHDRRSVVRQLLLLFFQQHRYRVTRHQIPVSKNLYRRKVVYQLTNQQQKTKYKHTSKRARVHADMMFNQPRVPSTAPATASATPASAAKSAATHAVRHSRRCHRPQHSRRVHADVTHRSPSSFLSSPASADRRHH